MLDQLFLQQIVLSIFVGALLGLEREFTRKQRIIGIRTFALVSLLGLLMVKLSVDFFNNYLLCYIGFAIVCFFALGLYYNATKQGVRTGFTTNIAFIISYLFGMMIGFDYMAEAVFLGVIVAVILYSKDRLHTMVEHLDEKEVLDLLEFLILLGVVYPILPEKIAVLGISIPLFTLWLLVVIMSIINFAAFIGSRYTSARNEIAAISFLGGLVSSTATTFSLSNLYRKNKKMKEVISGGLLLANSSSMLRNMLLIMIPFPAILYYLGPAVAAAFTVFIIFSYFSFKKGGKRGKLCIKSPFNVAYGVKLAVIVIMLYSVMEMFPITHSEFIILFAFLGGFLDTSAVTITLITLATQGLALPVVAISAVLSQMGGFISNLFFARISGMGVVVRKDLPCFVIASALLIAIACLTQLVIV
ncbi:MAG: DUF4010 domain-containing protein [Candidatus Micrarchaeota archaeon]